MRTSHAGMILALALVALPSHAMAAWSNDPSVNLPVYTGGTLDGYAKPVMVSDGASGAIVFWMDHRNASVSGIDIYAQHIFGSGELDSRWPAQGLAIAASGGNDTDPAVQSDGAGGALVAWLQHGPCTCVPDIPDGCVCATHLNRTRVHHVLSSGQLDPAWPDSGVAVTGSSYSQYPPQLVSDGAGGAIVAFDSWGLGQGFLGLHSQHVLSSGNLDSAFPADGRKLSRGGGYLDLPGQHLIGMVSDDRGGALVAWDQITIITDIHEPTPPVVIFTAQHITESGAIDPMWPTEGLVQLQGPASSPGAGGSNLAGVSGGGVTAESSSPFIVSDGAGGAILAWSEWRVPARRGDVFAQRILATGIKDPEWPEEGRALCTAPGDQGSLVMASDGLGGAIVAWQDDRDSFSSDIYAQHVRRSGVVDPTWPQDGQPLCTAADYQWNVAIVSDEAGGVIAAWDDHRRTTSWDVYAQRVRRSSTPAWPQDGQLVHTAANRGVVGNVLSRAMVADGRGGAIVAWRDDQRDLYAQQIGGNGELGRAKKSLASVATLPFAATLALLTPNPIRGPASLRFSLPRRSWIQLRVFDTTGRLVRSLFEGEMEAGDHALAWNLQDERGFETPRGLYLVRLATPEASLARKIVRF